VAHIHIAALDGSRIYVFGEHARWQQQGGTLTPNPSPSGSLNRIDEARRHFLGVVAAVTARTVAVGALAATALPSLAIAQSPFENVYW